MAAEALLQNLSSFMRYDPKSMWEKNESIQMNLKFKLMNLNLFQIFKITIFYSEIVQFRRLTGTCCFLCFDEGSYVFWMFYDFHIHVLKIWNWFHQGLLLFLPYFRVQMSKKFVTRQIVVYKLGKWSFHLKSTRAATAQSQNLIIFGIPNIPMQ